MRTTARTALTLVTITASALALGACSFLEPTRDTEGRIVRATEMPSPDARVGDCFSFVENSNLALVSVVPCDEAHAYIVLDKGTFSSTDVEAAGGIQIAVNQACTGVFDAFVATAAAGVEPQPEFIVSTDAKPDGDVTNYSCLATDAAAASAVG